MTTTLSPQTLKLDLNVKQGAGADVVLTVVDAVGQPITSPAGYTIRAQIRRTSLGPVLFEWNDTPSSAQGSAVLAYDSGTAASTVTLSFTDEHSAAWGWRLAQWDVYLTNPLGQSTCLAAGVVRVEPAVTH